MMISIVTKARGKHINYLVGGEEDETTVARVADVGSGMK
jgi:hypothetical protein